MKQTAAVLDGMASTVAPRVGAWIETLYPAKDRAFLQASPPAWGRGLKHEGPTAMSLRLQSPPAWGRGLKHRKHP